MPFLDRPDGRIHYRVRGSGFPVLLFAPGGLRSRMEMWSSPAGGPPRPWVDWPEALPRAGFTAVAMDQRNAGRSLAAIEADHGWHTYAADHLALMDHLGFGRFHVLGGCIGGSFCLRTGDNTRFAALRWHGPAPCSRRPLGGGLAALASRTGEAQGRAAARAGPGGAGRDHFRPEDRHPVA